MVEKTGSGVITRLDKELPFLEYEFSWTDKATNEKKSAKCVFAVFKNEIREKLKTTELKVGDQVVCKYEQEGYDKVLVEVEPKKATGFNGGGGFRKLFDPEAEKRKQESIERQNARGIAKDVLALCLAQYPVAAKPENLENALILFPQLMEQVKKGERILLGGE